MSETQKAILQSSNSGLCFVVRVETNIETRAFSVAVFGIHSLLVLCQLETYHSVVII